MIRKEKLEELEKYINELKTIKVEPKKIKQEKKWIQSEVNNYYLNNGEIIPREKLIKGKNDGSAVIIMPVLKNKEILTIIEPRVFTELTVGIGFPAGYIENLEKPIKSAERELLEETGYKAEKMIELDTFYQDEGCSSALNHVFLALNVEQKEEQKLDESEIIKYMTFTYEELKELEKLNYIKGVNSKMALLKYKEVIK